MTHKEFYIWLDGLMTNRDWKTIKQIDIERIQNKIKEVKDVKDVKEVAENKNDTVNNCHVNVCENDNDSELEKIDKEKETLTQTQENVSAGNVINENVEKPLPKKRGRRPNLKPDGTPVKPPPSANDSTTKKKGKNPKESYGINDNFNIGLGQGFSVLDIVNACSEVTSKKIKFTYNKDFKKGISSSIKTGLKNISKIE